MRKGSHVKGSDRPTATAADGNGEYEKKNNAYDEQTSSQFEKSRTTLTLSSRKTSPFWRPFSSQAIKFASSKRSESVSSGATPPKSSTAQLDCSSTQLTSHSAFSSTSTSPSASIRRSQNSHESIMKCSSPKIFSSFSSKLSPSFSPFGRKTTNSTTTSNHSLKPSQLMLSPSNSTSFSSSKPSSCFQSARSPSTQASGTCVSDFPENQNDDIRSMEKKYLNEMTIQGNTSGGVNTDLSSKLPFSSSALQSSISLSPTSLSTKSKPLEIQQENSTTELYDTSTESKHASLDKETESIPEECTKLNVFTESEKMNKKKKKFRWKYYTDKYNDEGRLQLRFLLRLIALHSRSTIPVGETCISLLPSSFPDEDDCSDICDIDENEDYYDFYVKDFQSTSKDSNDNKICDHKCDSINNNVAIREKNKITNMSVNQREFVARTWFCHGGVDIGENIKCLFFSRNLEINESDESILETNSNTKRNTVSQAGMTEEVDNKKKQKTKEVVIAFNWYNPISILDTVSSSIKMATNFHIEKEENKMPFVSCAKYDALKFWGNEKFQALLKELNIHSIEEIDQKFEENGIQNKDTFSLEENVVAENHSDHIYINGQDSIENEMNKNPSKTNINNVHEKETQRQIKDIQRNIHVICTGFSYGGAICHYMAYLLCQKTFIEDPLVVGFGTFRFCDNVFIDWMKRYCDNRSTCVVLCSRCEQSGKENKNNECSDYEREEGNNINRSDVINLSKKVPLLLKKIESEKIDSKITTDLVEKANEEIENSGNPHPGRPICHFDPVFLLGCHDDEFTLQPNVLIFFEKMFYPMYPSLQSFIQKSSDGLVNMDTSSVVWNVFSRFSFFTKKYTELYDHYHSVIVYYDYLSS